MRLALTFALLLALSGASTASAAAPWSTPLAIGSATQCAPAIAFGGSGAGLVSWSPSCVSGPRVTTLASTSGQVLATVPRVLAQPPVVYGHDRTALLRQRLLTPATDLRHDSRTRLDIAFGRTGGSVGKARTLATVTNLEHLAFAGSPRGDLAVAWIEYRCRRDASGDCLSERRRLRIAVRPAGQAFRAPVTLSADARGDGSELHDSDPAIGFGPQGDLVVAYSGRRAAPSRQLVVLARVRRAGHGFGGAVVAGPRRASTDIAAAVTPAGGVYVAWGTQDGGEQADRPFVVRAAYRPATAARFRASKVLDPGAAIARPPGRVVLGVAADGTATVAWSQAVGKPATYPVRVAISAFANAFASFTQLAPSGAVHDIATGPGGTTLVVWGRLGDNPDQAEQIVAAIRPGGSGTFGAAEAVSGTDAPSIAVAAFDPVTGQPAIVWTARQPGAATGVRLASRPAVAARSARSSHTLCHRSA